jgi:phage tail-like protein
MPNGSSHGRHDRANCSDTPTDVNVILMNEKSEPLRTWKVAHAIPKKWMVTDLNANDNTVVIETMELSYRYFTIQ